MKRNAQTAASVPFIMDEPGSVRSGSSQLQRAALNSGRRLHELEIDLSAGDGIATVFLIPANIEPFFWLAIFCVCGVCDRQAGSKQTFRQLGVWSE
jgi:hypothetical protein